MLTPQERVESQPEAPVFVVRFRMRITLLLPFALLAIAWVWGPSPMPLRWWLAGGLCMALGIALRIWAAGCLRKGETVTCWGPFAYVRNPLYLGTCLLGFGYACFTGRWEALPLVPVTMLLVYVPTAQHEERMLLAAFGDAFSDYCRMVPGWLPRLTRPTALPAGEPFHWALMRRNGEHRHVLAQLVFLAGFVVIHLLKG